MPVRQFTLVHFLASLVLVLGMAKKTKKKTEKVSLCCVSLGVGNEGLSNGNSYFILSIIYGETRFRKGHCMLVISIPLESQLEGVQINGDTCFC